MTESCAHKEGGDSVRKPDENNINMEVVYQEYASLVYRFLYVHTHDAHWSEELMQEPFLRAVTARLQSIFCTRNCAKRSVWRRWN